MSLTLFKHLSHFQNCYHTGIIIRLTFNFNQPQAAPSSQSEWALSLSSGGAKANTPPSALFSCRWWQGSAPGLRPSKERTTRFYRLIWFTQPRLKCPSLRREKETLTANHNFFIPIPDQTLATHPPKYTPEARQKPYPIAAIGELAQKCTCMKIRGWFDHRGIKSNS